MCLHFVVQCPQKIDKLTAVHPYFPSTVTKAFVKLIKQHAAAYYALSTSLLIVANRGSITSSYIHSAHCEYHIEPQIRYWELCVRSIFWGVCDRAKIILAPETRNTSTIAPTVLSTSLLEDWHDNGILPVLWYFVSHFPRPVQNSVFIG